MTRRRILAAATAGVAMLGVVVAVAAVTRAHKGSATTSNHRQHAADTTVDERATPQTIWTCPMHPQIVEEEPGTCPICGMDLVPKTMGGDSAAVKPASAGGPSGGTAEPAYEGEPTPSGQTVTIDPVVVQNMGVRVATVERGQIARRVRTVGTVDVAESQVSVVNLRYSGWIERIFVDETGERVRKGEALFRVYSPELFSAQEEYLLAIRSAGEDSPLARSARNRLAFWDLSNAQIAKIEKRGEALRTLTVVAPQSGYVLHKNVVQGARVEAGRDLYRIGDLGKIWVNADVYEFDAPWVQLGDAASMELSFQQGKAYAGKVSFIHPTLDLETRTLTVRLEFENPGLRLKPGMFATVEIASEPKTGVLVVPTEAIIRSGTRQIVFVTPELGRYDVRRITTGLVGDNHVTEVLSGLAEGERVVVSGQFLLDSESQLQEAIDKLLEARLQAREKRDKGSEARHTSSSAGAAGGDEPAGSASYWTCGMHPSLVQEEPGTCPICGMNLTEKKR